MVENDWSAYIAMQAVHGETLFNLSVVKANDEISLDKRHVRPRKGLKGQTNRRSQAIILDYNAQRCHGVIFKVKLTSLCKQDFIGPNMLAVI